MPRNPDFNIDINRDVSTIRISEEGGIYPENNYGPISYNGAIIEDSIGTSNHHLFDVAPNTWCYICSVSDPSYLRFKVSFRTGIDEVKTVVCNAGGPSPEYKVENGTTTTNSRVYIVYDNVTTLYYVFCRQPSYADSYCDIEILQSQGSITYYFTAKGTGATPSDPTGSSTPLDTDSDDSIWSRVMGHLVINSPASGTNLLTLGNNPAIKDFASTQSDIDETDANQIVSSSAIFNTSDVTRAYDGPFASHGAVVNYGLTGNKVMVLLPGYTAASTAAAPITVASSDIKYRPTSVTHGTIRVTIDGGTNWLMGHYAVQTNGSIIIYNGLGTANFPTGGGEVVGFETTTICYLLVPP
jgi:hypothetical protein